MDSDPNAIIEGFSQKLQSEWEQHRRQSFNTNTKGKAYERALKGFLEEYFDGVYKIQTRTAVIDSKLNCFDVLSAGENEIDVVASFRQAIPNLILKSGDMIWVPWDAVSFICEVKSSITKGSLESDLEKLAALTELGSTYRGGRFPQMTGRTSLTTGNNPNKRTVQSDVTVDHQLKCLVYDENKISGESLLEVATEFTEIWDLILIVDDNTILVSPELPFVDGWYSRFQDIELENGDQINLAEAHPDVLVLPDGLVWFILLISMSIPRPPPFDASTSLMRLVQGDWQDENHEYSQLISAWDRLFDFQQS